MSEPIERYTHDRRTRTAQFYSRVSRYRNLLRRRWWVLVLGALLGVAVQAVLLLTAAPVFNSVGRMIVNIKLMIPEGSVYTEELSNFLGTQSALMQSGVVVNRAAARLAADKPGASVSPVNIRVNVQPRTTIFVMVASGGEPEYTQKFLQACMEEYVNLKKEMRLQTSDTTLAGLTDEVLRLQRELRKGDEELAAFQSTNSFVLLQEQGNSAVTYLAEKTRQLAALKFEYELLNTFTLDETLERQGGSGLKINDAGRPLESDENYLKVKQQITLLRADQAELGQYLRPKHPKMVALDEEIARRERLLDIFRQQSQEDLERRRRTMKVQIDTLEAEARDWEAKNLEISRKTAEYTKLKANNQRVQQLYDRLLATMQTLDVNKEISPESVTIMERASAAMPIRPSLPRAVATGGLIGLGIATVLLLLLDRLDDRMNSVVELEGLFDEDVLGQIPNSTPSAKSGRMMLAPPDDDRHSFIESYRNLRSSLLFMAEAGKRPRALLVTSATPNEGKSLTAANLAITLANAGSQVLLVDADLRKGLQHKHFDLPEKPGLSESLTKMTHWAEFVQKTNFPNLAVLPRGSATQLSGDLLLGARIEKYLQEMGERYEYVVVDTVPVMAADDVASLAPHLDGVLFVIRAEQTSARVAHASLELLYQRQARVLGLVFNGVRSTAGDYYHYHKYKDYYREYRSA